MLPIALYASYLTYKADTNLIVSWLAENGQKCGFSLASTSAKQSRLKGKARAEAKAPSQDHAATNVIPTSFFVPLAERIMTASRKITSLPKHIALALDRAIATRREHNQWHSLQNLKAARVTDEEEEAQSGHVHFVEILEQVRQVLKPIYPTKLEMPADTSRSLVQELANRFSKLHIEEPTMISAGSTIPELPQFTKPAVEALKYEAEIIDDYDEAFVAASCLIDDLNEIREFLRKSWKAYVWQNVDLVSVSVVTDAAVSVVRANILDFEARYPRHSTLTAFIKDIFNAHCGLCQVDNKQPKHKDPPFNYAAAGCADTSFLWIDSLWKACSTAPKTPSDGAPAYKPSPSWHRAASNGQERFAEHKAFLSSFLPDYMSLAANLPRFKEIFKTLDSLTFGLCELSQHGGEPHFWLLFALQVFLDIRDELGSHNNRGFEDLIVCARSIEHETAEHLSLDDYYPARIAYWPSDYATSFNQHVTFVGKITRHDYVEALLRNPFEVTSTSIPPPRKQPEDKRSYLFLKQHPQLCGLLMLTFEFDTLNLGLQLADVHSIIPSATHLYNAFMKNRYLEVWPDIEILIEHQGEAHLFVGGRPTQFSDCLKKFDLACYGTSLQEYSRNNRLTGPVKVREANKRKLNTASIPITELLRDEYHRKDSTGIINSDRVLKSLTTAGKSRGFDMSTKTVDWLKLLLHCIHNESPRRRFNYLNLDRTCRQILQLISDLRSQPALPPSLQYKDVFSSASASSELVDISTLSDEVYSVLVNAASIGKTNNKKKKQAPAGFPFGPEFGVGNPEDVTKHIARAISEELMADPDNVGTESSCYATKLLADACQTGSAPDLRIGLKTTLLIHAVGDTATTNIDNYYNNRGGDSMLKRMAPGEKLSSVRKDDFVLPEMPAATASTQWQSDSFIGDDIGGLDGAMDDLVDNSAFETVPTTTTTARTTSSNGKRRAAAALPESFYVWMDSLPPVTAMQKHPPVDIKAMCRELEEDGVLTVLEQVMLMVTGK